MRSPEAGACGTRDLHRGRNGQRGSLSFVEAELLSDDGRPPWRTATRVPHMASPVESENVTDEESVIGPAREVPCGCSGMPMRVA